MSNNIYDNNSIKCSCILCKKEFSIKGINNHYLTKHTQAGNEKIRKASKFGNLSQKKKDLDQKIRDNNHYQYYLSPKICLHCQKIISYEKRFNNFCNSSCGASFNNKNKPPRSEESKQKTSESLKKIVQDLYLPKTNIKFCKCEICNKQFIWNDIIKGSFRFCSEECLHTHRSNKARVNPGLGTKRSKDEIKLFELCKNHFNNVTSNEKLFDGWDADILLNDYKIAILWNGPWHYQEMNFGNHSLFQVQNRDKIKKEEIKNAGWEYIVYEDRYFTPQTAFENLLLYIK